MNRGKREQTTKRQQTEKKHRMSKKIAGVIVLAFLILCARPEMTGLASQVVTAGGAWESGPGAVGAASQNEEGKAADVNTSETVKAEKETVEEPAEAADANATGPAETEKETSKVANETKTEESAAEADANPTGPAESEKEIVEEAAEAAGDTTAEAAEENAAAAEATELTEETAESFPASDSPAEITIRMVGDDLIHKPIFQSARQEDGSYNFDYIFSYIKDDIQEADIAIINQETILIHDPSQVSSFPNFGTPEAIGHSIAAAGFDVVAHANNHTMDKGYAAIANTVNFWRSQYPEIQYLGIHDSPQDSEIRYLTRNGIKVGFVNYTFGLNGIRLPRGREYSVDLLTEGGIGNVMAEARANSDLLVAVLHVGEEYKFQPTAYERQQVERFIDMGADIVLCAHPHVLEPYGMVTTRNGRTGLVYYSLGNFVSAQYQLSRVLGGMADITVRKNGEGEEASVEIVKYDLVPLVTHIEGARSMAVRLDQYTDEMAGRHKLAGAGLTPAALWQLYDSIMKGTAR